MYQGENSNLYLENLQSISKYPSNPMKESSQTVNINCNEDTLKTKIEDKIDRPQSKLLNLLVEEHQSSINQNKEKQIAKLMTQGSEK